MAVNAGGGQAEQGVELRRFQDARDQPGMGLHRFERPRAKIGGYAGAVEDMAEIVAAPIGAALDCFDCIAKRAEMLREMSSDKALRAKNGGSHQRHPMVFAGAP